MSPRDRGLVARSVRSLVATLKLQALAPGTLKKYGGDMDAAMAGFHETASQQLKALASESLQMQQQLSCSMGQ